MRFRSGKRGKICTLKNVELNSPFSVHCSMDCRWIFRLKPLSFHNWLVFAEVAHHRYIGTYVHIILWMRRAYIFLLTTCEVYPCGFNSGCCHLDLVFLLWIISVPSDRFVITVWWFIIVLYYYYCFICMSLTNKAILIRSQYK